MSTKLRGGLGLFLCLVGWCKQRNLCRMGDGLHLDPAQDVIDLVALMVVRISKYHVLATRLGVEMLHKIGYCDWTAA